jgi:hypothetical protein
MMNLKTYVRPFPLVEYKILTTINSSVFKIIIQHIKSNNILKKLDKLIFLNSFDNSLTIQRFVVGICNEK